MSHIPERHLRAIGIAAAPIMIFILVVWLGSRPFSLHGAPAAAPPSPPGTFRVSARQLKILMVEEVRAHGFVSDELTAGVSESAAVPEAAVVYQDRAAHVWVVVADDLLSFRTIRTGRSADGLIEVLDGLKPGERVVTKGGLLVHQRQASSGLFNSPLAPWTPTIDSQRPPP
jgi:hypothetical protein